MNKQLYKKVTLTSMILLTGFTLLQGVQAEAEGTGKTLKETPKVFKSVEETKQSSQQSDAVLSKAEQLNQKIIKAIEESRQAQKKDKRVYNSAEDEKIALAQEATSNLQDLKRLQQKTSFKGYNVNSITGLTAEQLDQGLAGTGLAGLGKYFISAEKEYHVSALALAGIAANESSWGTSNFAKTRNNYFGYQAYDHDVDKAARFDSPKASIDAVSKLLANQYLDPAGAYYNGVTLQGINVRYASDVDWAKKAISNMNTILDKIY